MKRGEEGRGKGGKEGRGRKFVNFISTNHYTGLLRIFADLQWKVQS